MSSSAPDRIEARKLYAQLQADGFAGTYARVTEFIRGWRASKGGLGARGVCAATFLSS